MKNYAIKIGEKTFIYKGSIAGNVPAQLTIWQRIKILFGAKVVITFQVFTKEWTTPVTQTAFSTVTFRSSKKLLNEKTNKEQKEKN